MHTKTARLFAILFVLLPMALYGQETYTIRCHIEGANGHTFYLADTYGGPRNPNNPYSLDSVIARSDTFSFSGLFTEHTYYSLLMDGTEEFLPFILDTGTTEIMGKVTDINAFRVKGSLQNRWTDEFYEVMDPLIWKRNDIADSINTDTIHALRHVETYRALTHQMMEWLESFAQSHPGSYMAFNYLDAEMRPRHFEHKDWGKKIFLLFSDRIKNSPQGKQFQYIHYQYNAESLLGKPFPPVTVYDVQKRLSEVRLGPNNIYLVDYWSSWCRPCIAKLPELKALAAKYESKGFKIISLSLDAQYAPWVQAVKQHEIPWENYSALKGFGSDDAKYFNIRFIPYTILVGKGNKIIQLNPTDEEVEAYLQSLPK